MSKVEALNLLELGTGTGRSCSQHPASRRDHGKVLNIMLVPRQMIDSFGLSSSRRTRNYWKGSSKEPLRCGWDRNINLTRKG